MKHFFFSALAFCLWLNSYAQTIRVFKNPSGDSTRRSIIKITGLPDGNLVQLGQVESDNNVDVSLTKVTPEGAIVWQKTFGTQNLDAVNNFIRLSDGGFAVVGYSDNPDDDGQMMIIKTDSLGIPQWAKLFGGNGFEEAFGVSELSNGEILVFGRTDSFSGLTVMALGAKFSASGELIWQKVFRFGSQSSYLYKAFEISSNEIIVCGYAWNLDAGPSTGFDPLFVKITANGDITTSNRLKMNNFQILYDWERAPDGGIYWAGTSSIPSGPNQNVIGKISTELTPVWTTLIGTPRYDRIWDMAVAPGGELVLSGFINKTTNDQSRRNGFVGTISSTGTFLNAMEFGSNDTNTTELTGITLLNGKAYAAGVTYGYGNTFGGGISIAIDPLNLSQICNAVPVAMTSTNPTVTNIRKDTAYDGGTSSEPDIVFGDNNEEIQTICTFVSIQNLSKSEGPGFFPNPGNGEFRVRFAGSKLRKISIYSTQGSLIQTQENTEADVTIHLKDKPAGLYRVIVSTDHDVFQTTLVKK